VKWNILVVRGREIKWDFVSSGEWMWIRINLMFVLGVVGLWYEIKEDRWNIWKSVV
jgi:hypothetical protein